MTAVLKTVLIKDYAVKRAACFYIDDVLVDKIEVTVGRSCQNVLTAKPSGSLENEMALVLKLQQIKAGKLMFR